MANEIQTPHNASGSTLYALVRNSTGDVWDPTMSSFVSYTTGDLANYDIALAEQGTASQYYAGTFPSSIDAGIYHVAIYDRAGGSPAEGDSLVANITVYWDGSAIADLEDFKADVSGLSTFDAAFDTVTVGAINSDVVSADSLATDAANEIADALLDRANGIETNYTFRQAMRLLLAALAGKLSGAGGTSIAIRDVNDAKDRISATVDADGNRTAVTTDVS